MAKSFTDYVQTVIVKKGLTGLFQCPGIALPFFLSLSSAAQIEHPL